MSRRTVLHNRITGLCLLVLWLAACAGTGRQVDYYTLAPLPRPAAPAPESGARVAITVHPVAIPAAIDRPQIATRTTDNQIALSEFHRWGGLLKDDIARVLAENLNVLLSGHRVNVVTEHLGLDSRYGVTVSVNRLDGRLADKVWLNAAWSIRDQRTKAVLAVRTTMAEEKLTGQGYTELVAAESRAIAGLSREIAAELAGVLKTP